MILLDGLNLDSHPGGTGDLAIADGFKWPAQLPDRQWAERKIGAVPIREPRIPNFEFEIPMRVHGENEDDVLVNFGLIAQKVTKVASSARTGGLDITQQIGDATYATTVKCVAADVSEPVMDYKHRHHAVADFVLKLVCLPYFLGPEYTAASGTKPAGIPAADITIADARGDLPGPARIVVTNQGTVAQQFALLGLQWRDAVSGNDMLLPASTFDVSTSPLNGTYTAGTNEVQRITPTGTISGGTWDWEWDGYAVTGIAYDSSVAATQTLIDAEVGAGNITVGGSALSAGFMSFTFIGDFAARNLTEMTVEDAAITGGGTLAASTTTPGVEGYVSTVVFSEWTSFTRTAAQTDTGSYDLWARVYDDGDTANQVLVRAIVSIGDTAIGQPNRLASITATDVDVWVNLGPVHANPQGAGTHKWTATIQAKTLGTEGTNIRVLDVLKVPSEHGRALVKVPQSSGGTISMRDNFGATSGALTGDTSTSGHTWATAGGVTDANDFTETAAPDNAVIRTDVSDTSTDIRYGRGVILGTATATDVHVSVDLTASAAIEQSYQGVIARFVDNDNFAGAIYTGRTVLYPNTPGVALFLVVAGVPSISAFAEVSETYGTLKSLSLLARVSGAWEIAVNGEVKKSGISSYFISASAIASGKSGIIDWHASAGACTRTYSNFTVTVPTPEEAAVYPSRDLQWSDDGGLHREALAGTDFSYAQGQQGVGVPLLGPEGAETLTNRLVIASADQNPTYAATGNQLPRLDYTVFHRPAYSIGRHTV